MGEHCSRRVHLSVHLSVETIQESSELKVFADDNFELDENGRKFSKQVENTVGKGEIAFYEQFLLFPQYFKFHCQLSRTCLIGTLAYQEIDEKIDVNRKSSGISGVWRTSSVCNR